MIEREMFFEWSIEDARVHTSLVKATCEKIYGPLSDRAWARWQSWGVRAESEEEARARRKAKEMSLDEFRAMVAIARLRVKDKWRELAWSEVERAKTTYDYDAIRMMLDSIHRRKLVHGAQMLAMLRSEYPRLGFNLERVQAIIPGFNYNGWYDMDKVRSKADTLSEFQISDNLEFDLPVEQKKARRRNKGGSK